MTAPTSPLLQALAAVKPRGCSAGRVIHTLTPEEQVAFTAALTSRAATYPQLAAILSDATAERVTARSLRNHNDGACSCE